MDSSLQLLLGRLSSLDFEEFGSIELAAATWAGNDLALGVVVHQPDHADERWRLNCPAVRRSRIMNNQGTDSLRIETAHPVLMPHTQPRVEVYFSSRPSKPDALIGQLVEAHRELLVGWFDSLYFFNLGPHHSLHALLDGGFGKLADGPEPLMEKYAQVLRRAGVKVSSPGSRPPVWWDGERWIQESTPLYALILGESYVVSETVTAERE
jgi:hypothetical protein